LQPASSLDNPAFRIVGQEAGMDRSKNQLERTPRQTAAKPVGETPVVSIDEAGKNGDEDAQWTYPQRIANVEALLVRRAEHLGAYHDHKENQAYAGAALATVLLSSILLMDGWPPSWLAASIPRSAPLAAGIGVTVLWLLLRSFIVWQLANRRTAAIRWAAIQTILARWTALKPTDDELQLWTAPHDRQRHRFSGWLRFHSRSDVGDIHWPAAVVVAWQSIEEGYRGTRLHEELLLGSGWLLYGAVIIRTML
jgi:hypothetical protein